MNSDPVNEESSKCCCQCGRDLNLNASEPSSIINQPNKKISLTRILNEVSKKNTDSNDGGQTSMSQQDIEKLFK